MLRQPIVTLLGHVDHGKTSILDFIRGSSVATRESGGITQHIGATEVPKEFIKKFCKNLLEKFKIKITLPGLLFIDTPGHHTFSNLRKRGGAISDIALLVVDINEGFQPQTVESIEILRQKKTPFMVAANKIDRIHGWRSSSYSFLENYPSQSEMPKQFLDKQIYKLMGDLSRYNFDAERFDRVVDFTKQVAIVPLSAKTGEGISELLALLTGLAQQYLTKNLKINVEGLGKGTILEIKDTQGVGTTADVILYDGLLAVGDEIIFGGKTGPIKSKIKAILKPKPLKETRDSTSKFFSVKKVMASAGIRIVAADFDQALAGGQLMAVNANVEDDIYMRIKKDLESLIIATNKEGIILKTDTLGSLEALVNLFKKEEIPIKKADVGNITKKDVMDAEEISKKAENLGVILGFNVRALQEARIHAKMHNVKIILGDVIYKLMDDYTAWKEELKIKKMREAISKVVLPGKIRILPGYVFRQSKPAIVGVEVIEGLIKPGYSLMRSDGMVIGKIKNIQSEKETLEKGEKGKKVAISIDNAVVGKNIEEGSYLFTNIPKRDYKIIKSLKDVLSPSEKKALAEIVEIKIQKYPFWDL